MRISRKKCRAFFEIFVSRPNRMPSDFPLFWPLAGVFRQSCSLGLYKPDSYPTIRGGFSSSQLSLSYWLRIELHQGVVHNLNQQIQKGM